jgi:hypothetical protein
MTSRRRVRMKLFWNVGIEIYRDETVKAAVLWSRKAERQPPASCREEPGREVYSLWFENEAEAQGAALEALAMNKKREAAA